MLRDVSEDELALARAEMAAKKACKAKSVLSAGVDSGVASLDIAMVRQLLRNPVPWFVLRLRWELGNTASSRLSMVMLKQCRVSP